MCGIVGIVSEKPFSVGGELLAALKRLEYRGYDSAGLATSDGLILKKTGELDNLRPLVRGVRARAAIAHTRWATHGGVTEKNAHPHADEAKRVIAVHNGIIENADELREELEKKGHSFVSETDSEVIPHFLEECLSGMGPEEAMREFISRAEGTFAVLFIIKGEHALYAMKRDSPLVLGVMKGSMIVGSDIYAFSGLTDRAVFFEDDECAVIHPDRFSFFTKEGTKTEKEAVKISWFEEDASKERYEHFMLKEVHEQPAASHRLIQSLKTTQKEALERFSSEIRKSKRVVFLAAGTSYHASLIGVHQLSQLGIEAHTVIASEFENFLLVDKGTLVISVSQSGETMDVVSVLKDVKEKAGAAGAVVNVPYSTIQRMSDFSIETLAGQEVCVAATKTFTNQVIVMLALARSLGARISLDEIPGKIRKTIADNEKKVMALAESLKHEKDIFVLGRGISYPVAREIALKLKEISYIHAEGMMGGELKHGTIALIEKGTPVISLIPNHNPDMVSNTKEVEARGARTIVISNRPSNSFKADFVVPDSGDAEFAIYACIIGHLLSYHIARLNKLPIDKPRNLAKSVTVK